MLSKSEAIEITDGADESGARAPLPPIRFPYGSETEIPPESQEMIRILASELEEYEFLVSDESSDPAQILEVLECFGVLREDLRDFLNELARPIQKRDREMGAKISSKDPYTFRDSVRAYKIHRRTLVRALSRLFINERPLFSIMLNEAFAYYPIEQQLLSRRLYFERRNNLKPILESSKIKEDDPFRFEKLAFGDIQSFRRKVGDKDPEAIEILETLAQPLMLARQLQMDRFGDDPEAPLSGVYQNPPPYTPEQIQAMRREADLLFSDLKEINFKHQKKGLSLPRIEGDIGNCSEEMSVLVDEYLYPFLITYGALFYAKQGQEKEPILFGLSRMNGEITLPTSFMHSLKPIFAAYGMEDAYEVIRWSFIKKIHRAYCENNLEEETFEKTEDESTEDVSLSVLEEITESTAADVSTIFEEANEGASPAQIEPSIDSIPEPAQPKPERISFANIAPRRAMRALHNCGAQIVRTSGKHFILNRIDEQGRVHTGLLSKGFHNERSNPNLLAGTIDRLGITLEEFALALGRRPAKG